MKDSTDAVIDCVQSTFDKLPPKARPRRYPDGSREWVPLSGIVLSSGENGDDLMECVALGTGMRCLPSTKLAEAKGQCLHDWHAEIVALRAFNLFLVQECEKLVENPSASSRYIRQRPREEINETMFQPFELYKNVEITMYCTEAPCGDASMELIMQDQADQTAWHPPENLVHPQYQLHGRGYFSTLGAVRRKPGRGDASPTLSKSCSDKLALKQCTSLLSSLSYLLITPCNVYLRCLILPEDRIVNAAVQRCFGSNGRMSTLTTKEAKVKSWAGGFQYKPFKVDSTERLFHFSRLNAASNLRSVGSNITAVWTPSQQEVLIGGTLQGHKQFSPRGASIISRTRMWAAVLAIAVSLNNKPLIDVLRSTSYSRLKTARTFDNRRAVKQEVTSLALQNWVPNDGDDFSL